MSKTIYVDNQSTESGDGSLGNPFLTIAEAYAKAGPDDTIAILASDTIAWWNFKTKQFEYYREGSIPDNLEDYIPQVPEAQVMYRLLQEGEGMSPTEAAIETLKIATSVDRAVDEATK